MCSPTLPRRSPELSRERNVEALVNVNVADVDEAAGEEVDVQVGAAGGADSEGGAAEPLEGEPALADEGARVVARLGVEQPPEDVDDQLVGDTRVDPIMASASHRSHNFRWNE